MKTAIYPGSFDPVTYGHLDIIQRASQAFDKVVVAVGTNPSKKYLFPTEKRIELLKKTIKQSNVQVEPFDGLLADFAYERKIKTIVKGVRNSQDFDYERLLHEVTVTQQSGIDTHILVADTKLNHVSSSATKELCKHNGLIHEYVPLAVKEELEWRLNYQYVIGITGEIGMGKSYTTDMLLRFGQFRGCRVFQIDLDKLAHEIYTSPLEVHIALMERIAKDFNLPGFTGKDRKKLGEIVFNDKDALTHLNDIMRIPMLTSIRRQLASYRSEESSAVVLLNGALLVEANYLHLCNNNVVLVHADKSQQIQSLLERGLKADQISRRIDSQLSTSAKQQAILDAHVRDGHGWLLQYKNVRLTQEEYDSRWYNELQRFTSEVVEVLSQEVREKVPSASLIFGKTNPVY